MIHTEILEVRSEGGFYALNITDEIKRVIEQSGVTDGDVLAFYQHTTGCIMITEHEVGILVDLQDTLDKIIPETLEFKHHLRGADANGAAHLRAGLFNPAAIVPIMGGKLMLGTWQEILMIDLDEQTKTRKIIVQVRGE